LSNLENLFHQEMINIYARGLKECGYRASRFLVMVNETGGLQAAKTLINAPGVSDGFAALWERGRPDLTVEAIILDPKWKELFTGHELDIARGRLSKVGLSCVIHNPLPAKRVYGEIL